LFARNPALSPEIREAVTQQASSEGEGLRIDMSVSAKGEAVERRYIQDIFRTWTKKRAAQPQAQEPPADEAKADGKAEAGKKAVE
ncbi:MAG: hypothetical protein JXR97_10665, partial [Planctomycetes bacterium]|nr:hypothetical protein [Planctomycetota bacterium]